MELFKTTVGSHMWKMNHEKSDIDLTSIYMMNSRDFILGKKIKGKHQVKEINNIDLQQMEFGHFFDLLLKSNINAIWIVMSPIINFQYKNSLTELRQIQVRNYSKKCYYSILGMAKHNISHFIENNNEKNALYKKKVNVVGRTLLFGINLLKYKKAMFKPVNIKTEKELWKLKDELDVEFENSTLPKEVNTKPFKEYYIKYRKIKMKLDGLI